MKKSIGIIFAIITSVILIMLTYYATAQNHMMHKPSQSINTAICVLGPTDGSEVSGIVTFTQTMQGIKVVAELNGLTVGAHGFHIHEFGDCSAADGTSAGGHFNPEGHEHAGLDAELNHVGDLGNLVADQNGHAHLEFTTTQIQFEGTNSIIGRSIIVHAQADDLKSQPTGNAGARVACGTIGIAK